MTCCIVEGTKSSTFPDRIGSLNVVICFSKPSINGMKFGLNKSILTHPSPCGFWTPNRPALALESSRMTFMSSESTGLGDSTLSGCDVALTMSDSIAGRSATTFAATSCFIFKLILLKQCDGNSNKHGVQYTSVNYINFPLHFSAWSKRLCNMGSDAVKCFLIAEI